MTRRMATSALSIVVSICLVLLCVPLGAFAADGESGMKTTTVGSWTLNYTVDGDSATIEGVAAAGSGRLVIPSSLDGKNVTAIASAAFQGQSALTSVDLPDTITTIGGNAFMNTGLKEVSIPANVEGIRIRTFMNCSDLAKVTFEGDSIGYLGFAAFMNCTSLVEMAIPLLTDEPPADNDVEFNHASISRFCFSGCSNLEKITFMGEIQEHDYDYFAYANCFDGCDKLETFVYYTKGSEIPSGMSSTDTLIPNIYYTLDFYNSEADSKAYKNKVATTTYNRYEVLFDILNNKASSENWYAGAKTVPSAPEGKVWGVADHGLIETFSLLSDSYHVVAVDRENLDYAYISSSAIAEYDTSVIEGTNNQSMYSAQMATLYMDSNKNVDGLDQIKVYAADGTELDSSCYTLKFEEQYTENRVEKYKEVSAINEEGEYRVTAVGTGSYANTETASVDFQVVQFEPTVTSYSTSDSSKNLARSSADAAAANSKDAMFGVVVPESDWRYQLIGAGLAGVGNGVELFDAGKNTSSEMVRAFIQSGASSIQVLGSTSVVPESRDTSKEVYLVDCLKERNLDYSTRYSEDTSVQSLAMQVYTSIRKQHQGEDVWGAGWGTTAIIVSPSCNVDTMPVAQLAYQKDAPVFFTESNGTVSADVINVLASDGFTEVIIAGDETYVSASCAESVASATGITPTRVLAEGETSLDASEAFTTYMANSEGVSTGILVVASTASDAYISAAAQMAAIMNCAMLTCSSTSDSKQIQRYVEALMENNGVTAVRKVYIVGSTTLTDSELASRMEKLWTDPLSTASSASDTVECGDYVCKLSGSKATVVALRNHSLKSAKLSTVSSGGTSYQVSAVGASAFAGSAVTSVTLGSSVSSIGASAFSGCTSLKTATLSSGALKKIPSKAFYGCSSLKTLTIKSSKVSSVGSKAFKNVKATVTVKVPKAKISKYKKMFRAKGLSNKAKFKKC